MLWGNIGLMTIKYSEIWVKFQKNFGAQKIFGKLMTLFFFNIVKKIWGTFKKTGKNFGKFWERIIKKKRRKFLKKFGRNFV